ncbi:MAG: uracil-DNA glycosylase family protein [Nitrospinota bacterium]
MEKEIDFCHCTGWRDQSVKPEGVVCPPCSLKYPEPPNKVDTLFLAWNPPGEKHFWNSEGDRLRKNLKWVLCKLRWMTEPNLIEKFLERGCYLVHAVRCWPYAGWPPDKAINTCARALLARDLKQLRPKTLCILGQIPHIAAKAVIPRLPPPSQRFRYGRGWCKGINGLKVIITTFPNTRWNRGEMKSNRECTLSALRQWL